MSWILAKDKYKAFLSIPSSKWREKGNESFSQRRFDDAILEYSASLLLADQITDRPSLLTNRSAAFLELGCFENAFWDAESSVRMSPDWWRGYLRIAAAQVALNRNVEAIRTLKVGISRTTGTGKANLEQSLKEASPKPLVLLKSKGSEESIITKSPLHGGATKPHQKRSKNSAAVFQCVEQGDTHTLASIIANSSGKDPSIPSSANVSDTNTNQTPLHAAAANLQNNSNQLEIIWMLLEAGLRPEARDKIGLTPITFAAIRGNTLGLAMLIGRLLKHAEGRIKAQTVFVGYDDHCGFDVLCHAVLADQADSVRMLVDEFGYTNISESRFCAEERTIVHIAAVNGSPNALLSMLNATSDPIVGLLSKPDKFGFTPLGYAAANMTRRHLRDGKLPLSVRGKFEFSSLQVPLEAIQFGGSHAGISNWTHAESRSWTTLIYDSRCTSMHSTCPHAEFITKLLETGLVDVNELQGNGEDRVTALFLAALFGHNPVVNALLAHGAKQDIGTASPMQASTSAGFSSTTHLLCYYDESGKDRLLAERKPFLGPTRSIPDSPLTISIASSADIRSIVELLSAGCLVSGHDIQLAILRRDPALLDLLLARGGSISSHTEMYGALTGMATAIDIESLEMLKIALQHATIFSEVDSHGKNILHHVCELGKSDALLLILEELQDKANSTAEHKDLLKTMLRPSPRLPSGKASPLELAARNQNSSCFKILQSHLTEVGFTKSELVGGSFLSSGSAGFGMDSDSKQNNSPSGTNNKQKSTPQQQQDNQASSSALNKTSISTAGSKSQQQWLSDNTIAITLAPSSKPVKLMEGFSEMSAWNPTQLRKKLNKVLNGIKTIPDSTNYLATLHHAFQDHRTSHLLIDLGIVKLCLTKSLETANAEVLVGLTKTLVLLPKTSSSWMDEANLDLVFSLFDKELFMSTPKAQAFLMVSLNNECAAHPKVSPRIVSRLTHVKKYIHRFFECAIKAAEDEDASPAGIGLLDLFTHVFLSDKQLLDTYKTIIYEMGHSITAILNMVKSLNNVSGKIGDITISIRMIQRIAHAFPSKLILCGVTLPLLRICSYVPTVEANSTVVACAYTAFGDLLKFSNQSQQRLLWNLMSHSQFLDHGLKSSHLEARTASCDAIVCLCRDPAIQAELQSDPKHYDLLLDLFEKMAPSVLLSGEIVDTDSLSLRECIIAMTFLWNRDPKRITAMLQVPKAFDILLALYHTDGIAPIANRVIQFLWAYNSQLCQQLLSSPLTSRLYSAYLESSKFNPSQQNLSHLLNSEAFGTPKWHTTSDGVYHEEIEGVSCAYCGVGSIAKKLMSPVDDKSIKYCSKECQAADWRRYKDRNEQAKTTEVK